MNPTNSPASNPTFKDLALPCIARGFKTIPVARGAKRPVWMSWPDLASNTLEGMAALQAMADNDDRFTEWNCGLVADPAIHCVLDCDTPSLVEQIERETGRKIPATLTVRSAGKGCPHFYFLPTERSPSLGNPSTGKFDFWTSRHQTVAPGSIGTSGRSYELALDAPMVPIPDWLCDWIATQKREWASASGDPNAGALGRLKAAYFKSLDPEDLYGIEGLDIDSGLHPTVHSMACVLHDGERTADDLIEILDKEWVEYGHRGQQQSGDETEVEGIVRQVLKKEPFIPTFDDVPSYSVGLWIFRTKEDMDKWLAERAADWHSIFHSYEDFCNAPPVKFAIAGFLQESAITLIGGVPGHGKTFIMLSMTKALLTGKPLFGHAEFAVPEPAKRVVYLCPEVGMSPFSFRLKLFKLDEYVRSGKLLFAGAKGERVSGERLLTPEKSHPGFSE